ncbi:hypothetical protein BJ085DRAFT_36910 [Dimargaris cristalligena]|uniref:Uncharacterized protein n=1 Tax=Dimargaris cristalligena TaxID=215637 RepID=A0A4V1J3Y2_9FUNG|nr:hypothetical protein BJ085DRAFT_36910 [Dimargaris cristalligena]|eukprot:RKP33649.1 hypothetical protein BJ085DRAFT_36910 [Dimargaris cristalligena]
MSQMKGIYASQTAWDTYSSFWFDLAPLDMWDYILQALGDRFGSSSNTPLPTIRGGPLTAPCTNLTSIERFALYNRKHPLIQGTNRRMNLVLQSLDAPQMALYFPLAHQLNGEGMFQLVQLLQYATETPVNSDSPMPDVVLTNPQDIDVAMVASALSLRARLPVIIIRTVYIGVWDLYREGETAEIFRFLRRYIGPHRVADVPPSPPSIALKIVLHDVVFPILRFLVVLAAQDHRNEIIDAVLDLASAYPNPTSQESFTPIDHNDLMSCLNTWGPDVAFLSLRPRWPKGALKMHSVTGEFCRSYILGRSTLQRFDLVMQRWYYVDMGIYSKQCVG